MSSIRFNLELVNEIPKINIKLLEDKEITQEIADLQIKSNLNEVFIDNLKLKKEKINFLNGVVITRNLSVNKNIFKNKFIKIFEDDNIEFFDDINECKKAEVPSIIDYSSNSSDIKIKYDINYFQFPANFIYLNDEKLEESIIYENYRKNKNNISSKRLKNIIKVFKSNNNFKNIDEVFFNIFSKDSITTNELILRKKAVANINLISSLNFIDDFLCLIVEYENINKFDIDIENINLYKQINNKQISILDRNFGKKEVKYDIQDQKIYIPLMNTNKIDFYNKVEDNLFLNIKIRVYNKKSLNPILSTNKNFKIKG